MGEFAQIYEKRVASGALTADTAQHAAAERLDALSVALGRWRPNGLFGRGETPRGLYLWGGVGGGKSLLMNLFFETAPVAKKKRAHFHEFMLARHAFLKAARDRGQSGHDQLIVNLAKDVAAEARLLCLDEFQVSDIADAMLLGRLFEQLFARGVVIVTTSNRAPDDLYKNGLNRQLFLPAIDMLKAELDVVPLHAARDFRLDRLLETPIYAAPLGPDADAAMDAIWGRLTQGAAEELQSFDVQARHFIAPRTAAGCARFDFQELCGKPLGAADYLEIAQRFHTVLIDRIPALSPEKRDEAARFRTLVDALYEAKTKLVCSAAAEPAALYPAGDQSFEFARTASRLMEMRAQDYLRLSRRDAEFTAALRET